MPGVITPGTAVLILRRAVDLVTIPGHSWSRAIKFSVAPADVILIEPDGAGSVFTLTQGAAGDGPGTYITINRRGDFSLHIQPVTTTIDTDTTIVGRVDDGSPLGGEFQTCWIPITGSSQVSNTFTWGQNSKSEDSQKFIPQIERILPLDVDSRIYFATCFELDPIDTTIDCCKVSIWEVTKETPADGRYATVFYP